MPRPCTGIRQFLDIGSGLPTQQNVHEVTTEPAEIGKLVQMSTQAGAPWVARDRTEILRFFDGFDPVDPGLVTALEWRPPVAQAVDPERMWVYAGVGRKP